MALDNLIVVCPVQIYFINMVGGSFHIKGGSCAAPDIALRSQGGRCNTAPLMAFLVSWVRILTLFVSPADLEVVLPTLELPEDALPALSPYQGNPPVVVVSLVTSDGLTGIKAKNPAAIIIMIMAVIIIFFVLFIFIECYLELVVFLIKKLIIIKINQIGIDGVKNQVRNQRQYQSVNGV